jgi:hypothetical protein
MRETYQSDKERDSAYKMKRASGATKRVTEMLKEIRIQNEFLQLATQMKLDLIAEEMAAMDSMARSSNSELSLNRSARTTDNMNLELSSGSEKVSSEKEKRNKKEKEKEKEKGKGKDGSTANFCENVPFYARMTSPTKHFRKHSPKTDKSHHNSYSRKSSDEGRTQVHGQSSVIILGLLNAESDGAPSTQSM